MVLRSSTSWTVRPDVLSLVRRLNGLDHDVVLGVTTHLDPRQPGNECDRIRLGDLLALGRERVAATWDPPRCRPLMERLERVVSNVDLRDGGHGIVVIATPDLAAAHLLRVSVAERIATGAGATISILLGALHEPRSGKKRQFRQDRSTHRPWCSTGMVSGAWREDR
jgi:hypothetical protein